MASNTGATDPRSWVPPGERDPLEAIRRLGLEQNIAELDAYGFTAVPPEKVAPPGFARAVLDAVLATSERRFGVKPAFETGETHANQPRGSGSHMFYLIHEDEVFEQAVMNETVQALVRYLLGDDVRLSSLSSIIKGPGDQQLSLHSDTAMVPAPFPAYAQVCNATYVLTPYDLDAGPLFFWPGSHRFCRQPTHAEMADKDKFVPVTAPVGTLLFWHGNTWHGAFPRKAPGLRVNLIGYFARSYFALQEANRDRVSPEALARNGPVFRKLMGVDAAYPFDLTGPNYARLDGEQAVPKPYLPAQHGR